MISQDAFYEHMNNNFNKLFDENKTILGRINEIKEELCDQITETAKKIDDHILVNKTLGEENEKNVQKTDRKVYFLIGFMGAITSVIALFT